MSNVPNFRDFCESACIKLWGEPDRRTQKELRWNGAGAYSARTFSVRKKVWYDHGQQRGGSTLDLVAYSKDQPKQQLRGPTFLETWAEAHRMGLVPDPPAKKKPNGGGGPVLATYPYTDENGATLFEVVRFDTANKDQRFRQRRPDGNGGWIWGVKGIRNRVLYRLRALIDVVKARKRMLICEGERDANTAIELGFPATTNPGGVNKWFGDYDEFFRGADVVVVSDNDPQSKDPLTGALQFHPDGRPIHRGQDHAAKVAKHMRKVAAHVRTVIFPQKDLSAWVEAGGGRAALEALIEAAPDQIKQPEPEPGADPIEEDEILAELNRDNCLVLDGGKAWVLRFEQVIHNLNGRRYSYRVPVYLRTGDFRTLYMNRLINTGDRFAELGVWWLKHPARRQYLGVVFEPGSQPVVDGKLNLWTGFGVEPKRGDWSLMRKHIGRVLAAGDKNIDAYIINWLAWMVQNPGQQPEIALVFLGKRGSGRGTLGNAMCRIFGNHGLHISSPDHLVGRFNAHLRQCAFLFCDEAYAAADRKAEGRLKSLITEPTITIEGKGRDVITVPNHLHVMMASNEDWVVPAGEIERRFQVQEVANDHAQDPASFKPLYEQLNDGGLEAMLFDLLNRDLGDWHPRQIIRTAALAAQQAESLSPFDAWWSDLLQTGYLPAGYSDGQVISGDYQARRSEGYLTDNSKRTWSEKRKGLYEQARTSSPGLKKATDAAFGRYLRKNGCTPERVCRQRGWLFPELNECRTKWMKRFSGTVWDQPDVTRWQGGRDQDDDE